MSQVKNRGNQLQKSKQESEIGKMYIDFLNKYPEIFSDLVVGADFDFAGYSSFDDFETGVPPEFVFHVLRTTAGIQILLGKAPEADVELALSRSAVQQLIQSKSKIEYEKKFGHFYNEPDEEQGWIDFVLKKRTKTIIDLGYGRFASEAGILTED